MARERLVRTVLEGARMQNELDAGEEKAPIDTVVMLPLGMTAAKIAAASREAAMMFVNESTSWGKAELAMWLAGTYGPVTRHASRESSPSSRPVALLRELDARFIDRIMASARAEILETLELVAKDGSASFVLAALLAGAAIRCEDSLGEPAWAPTDNASRLADRVLSLFAVDYLTRPGDYESELFVCASCEMLSFDGALRRRGPCDHRFQWRAASSCRRSTLPYPPLGA